MTHCPKSPRQQHYSYSLFTDVLNIIPHPRYTHQNMADGENKFYILNAGSMMS